VQDYPTLIVIQGEDINKYHGEIEFESLVQFLEPFAANDKKPHRNWDQFNPDFPEFDEKVINKDNFELEMTKDKRLAIIHFYTDSYHGIWRTVVHETAGMVLLGNFDCSDSEN